MNEFYKYLKIMSLSDIFENFVCWKLNFVEIGYKFSLYLFLRLYVKKVLQGINTLYCNFIDKSIIKSSLNKWNKYLLKSDD